LEFDSCYVEDTQTSILTVVILASRRCDYNPYTEKIPHILLGDEPAGGSRHKRSTVSSYSKQSIEAAKDGWKHARYGAVPRVHKETIPLSGV
jgi:hypothetical protein